MDSVIHAFTVYAKQAGLADADIPNFSTICPILAHWVMAQKQPSQPLTLGLSGAQGSGKSTLARLLGWTLQHQYGLTVATLSLDDFYLTRKQRQALAETVHPLLVSRGVPGTHDLSLAFAVLQHLKSGNPQPIALPRFDKALDDRCPESTWPVFQGAADVIIFEGWCVGVSAQAEADLQSPVNSLESEEDKALIWRHFVNRQLQSGYDKLYGLLDRLIFLKVPGMDCVYRWRLQQEQQLGQQKTGEPNRLMQPEALKRFIMHFERLSLQALAELPSRADITLELNPDHRFKPLII